MTPSPAEREKGRALRLLILGGTTEASALARALAGRLDLAPLLSLAGRTEKPVRPPIPYRVGGFGGISGLAQYLHDNAIDAVIDATHPFAARISVNALEACHQAGVSLAVYTRRPWTPAEGDSWQFAPDIDAAVAVLAASTRQGGSPEGLGIFLTTGRLDLARFGAAPQHRYLIRAIDQPAACDLPPRATVILARPPFTVANEVALMREHAIAMLVTKNSGGSASAAKLAAARVLGLPVLMVDRPPASGAPELQSLDAVLAWIDDRRARLAPAAQR